jgi:hypothetical protein
MIVKGSRCLFDLFPPHPTLAFQILMADNYMPTRGVRCGAVLRGRRKIRLVANLLRFIDANFPAASGIFRQIRRPPINDMINALASDRSDQSLGEAVCQGEPGAMGLSRMHGGPAG